MYVCAGEPHNAVCDAVLSMKLFKLYQQVKDDAAAMSVAASLLLDLPTESSFAKRNAVYDGVCMVILPFTNHEYVCVWHAQLHCIAGMQHRQSLTCMVYLVLTL